MGRKRAMVRHFALVYGGKQFDNEYVHGSFAVKHLKARTPEEALAEAKRKAIGKPERWYVGVDRRTGEIEFSDEGSGMLLSEDWAPPTLFVVELLDTPHDAWEAEAEVLRDEMLARFEKEHVEAKERAEFERLQKKYGTG